MKKALILSITAGMGHHKTGMAISNYLEANNVACTMLDTYEYITPVLSDTVSNGYLLTTKYTPKAFGKAYEIAMKMNNPEQGSFEKVFNKVSLPRIRKYIEDYKPDVIISTHAFSAMLLTGMINDGSLPNCLTVGIITDFTVHPFWEKTNLDYYVTASVLLDYQMNIKKHIPKEKILSFGIPIDPKFSHKIPKQQARNLIAIENKPTILIMMGSMGFGKIFDSLKDIDRLENDFQVILVCGNNKKLYKTATKNEWKHTFHIKGFVDNVDILMDAADVIITKPGGLTTSELLAKELPAILMSPIPGQENRNAEFLLNTGLAVQVTKLTPVDELLYQLLTNPWRMQVLSESAKHAAKPQAAKALGDFIIEKISG